MSKVSIVVPAYNEAAHIEKLLESLTRQTTRRPFQVVVVDNASTDDTAAVVGRWTIRLNVIVVAEPRRSRGAARAAGFAAANGDIILSTDADTVVPDNWVERLTDEMEKTTAVAISGTCSIADCAPRINNRFNWLQPQLMRGYRMVFGHYWLTGSNCAIRKDAYNHSKTKWPNTTMSC